jgi:hypothetical protein
MRGIPTFSRLAFLFLATLFLVGCEDRRGSVVSHANLRSVTNATIFHAGKVVRTDSSGGFVLKCFDKAQPLLVKAAGFRPARFTMGAERTCRVELEPFEARGLYLPYAVLGLPEVRARALQLLDGERLNALVVDIKDERGRMTFFNGAPCAGQAGAFGAVKFDDIEGFLKEMHQRRIYVAGRIVAFKDPLLAKFKPAWAARSKGRPSSVWVDPFRTEVQAYNIKIAKEAATVGFDEVLFDYARFPEARELPEGEYSRRDSAGARADAIQRFVAQAEKELRPFNACLALGIDPVAIQSRARAAQPEWATPEAVDYLLALVPDGQDLAGVMGAVVSEPRRFRACLAWKGRQPNEATMSFQNLQAAVQKGRIAGTGGWVLCDPAGQFDYSSEMIHALVPSSE